MMGQNRKIVPLDEKDYQVIKTLHMAKSGEKAVMLILGFMALSVAWYGVTGLFKAKSPDTGDFLFALLPLLAGVILMYYFFRARKRKSPYRHLLVENEKIVVNGPLEDVGLTPDNAVQYTIGGEKFKVWLPLQADNFVPFRPIEKLAVFNSPWIELHFAKAQPGLNVCLKTRFPEEVKRRKVKATKADIPQRSGDHLFALLASSVICFIFGIVLHAFFSAPVFLFAMMYLFSVFLAVPAVVMIYRNRRLYRIKTIVTGRVMEVIEAEVLTGRMRMPQTWYGVGGERYPVDGKGIHPGCLVELEYFDRGAKQPAPIRIAKLEENPLFPE